MSQFTQIQRNGGLFMLLWNSVVIHIFVGCVWAKAITFWQALGLWAFVYLIGAAFFATVKKIQSSN